MDAHLEQPENYSVCTGMHEVRAVQVACEAQAMPGVANIAHRKD